MGAFDTAKDIAKIAMTAPLSKEIIELLKTKGELLTEQMAALEKEKAFLAKRNEELALENTNLKTQLEKLVPKSDTLDPDTSNVLKLFFDSAKDIPSEQIARHFHWQQSVADYHIDVLLKRRFISQTRIGMDSHGWDGAHHSSPSMFCIDTLGRNYTIHNSLKP